MPRVKKTESSSNPETSGQANNVYVIASSIVIAGLLIAGAVIYDKNYSSEDQQASAKDSLTEETSISISPISDFDHVFGDRNAPIKMIEYSDLDCPACGAFNEIVMDGLKEEYIDTGKLAVVYRHLPLTSLHPDAFSKAIASECVAELGGQDSFWKFTDTIFREKTSFSKITTLATSLGINGEDFDECLISGRYDDLINSQSQEMISSGVNGTPFIIVQTPASGELYMPGVYPLENIKAALDQILTESEQ